MSDGPDILSAHIKRRAIRGARAMVLRTAYGQALRVVSSVCLARLLFPADYGVFGVVAYLTGLSMYLGDAGLAAALVRRDREPDRDELFTIFACHQLLTACIVAVLLALAGPLVTGFGLSADAATLLRVMACGLFLSSLRVVPMMRLERTVRFDTIARVELIESLVLLVVTVGLAAAHVGPWALAIGGLARSGVGLALIWRASPWWPSGRFTPSLLPPLLKFGLPFQLNALVPTILGGWMPFTVGRLRGPAAVGVANWATNLSSIPTSLAAALNRVAFPAFSRLQQTPAELAAALERTIVQVGSLMFLFAPLACLAAPWGIPLIFGERWADAIVLVQWFAPACVLTAVIGILASAQNAVGRAGDRLAIAAFVGLLMWPAAFIVVRAIGVNGIGPLSLAAAFGELVMTCLALQWRGTVDRRFLLRVLRLGARPLVFTAVAVGLQRLDIFAGRPFAQMLVGVAAFLALQAIAEWCDRSRPLSRQLSRTWSHVRVAAEPAAEPAPEPT